ncbi:MAG TPA: glycosyltransferase family 39 protein [Streptosporangiaceae bacterium]|nr:glycosyltransferase family 39 protein [Streptosporangiaceae bacterium]
MGSAGAAQPPDRPGPGPAWLPLIPALVTLLVGLYKITGPSFTRDESATLAAVHRSFPQLVAMLGHVDVVHGAYYALIWLVVRAGGSGEFALRLPSVIAMAIAAALVTVLGRRLVSSWAGLAAGLTFAFLPQVSWFAENAREGAVLTALACVASYCLLRALQQDAARGRWLVAYGVTLVALGLGNLFALLLVAAHAVTLAWSRRQYRVDRGFVLRWAAAVAVTLILVSPVAVVGYTELRQIHWIKPPSLYSLLSVERVIGDTFLFILVLVIVACAVVVSTVLGSTGADGGSRRSAHWPAGLLRLALPWLLLPPAILLTASVIHPVYTFRYIIYCIPAAALLIGAALAALGRYAGPVALVVIVLAGLHSQLAERRADGHDVDIRRADRIVARYERPGDALLNISAQTGPRKGSGERTLEGAYPYGLARLRDISAGTSPERSATLGGTYASSSVIRQRLAHVTRLWVVEWTTPKPVPVLDGLGFRLIHSWDVENLWLRLYARTER